MSMRRAPHEWMYGLAGDISPRTVGFHVGSLPLGRSCWLKEAAGHALAAHPSPCRGLPRLEGGLRRGRAYAACQWRSGGWLFRNADDPNEILLLLAWDDLERARLFADSDDLHEAMTRAGVTDRPDIWFLENVEHPTV